MSTEAQSLDNIKCPSCGDLIPISQALSHQIGERVRAEYKAEQVEQAKVLATREKAISERELSIENSIAERVKASETLIRSEAERKAKDSVAVEITSLKQENSEKDALLKRSQDSEIELRRKARELEEKAKNVDQIIAERVAEEAAKAKTSAEVELRKSISVEMDDLKRLAAEKDQELDKARTIELELRAEKRNIEEREKALELETARRVDAERAKVAEETTKRLQEEFRLREAEKDKKLQDAARANDELRRKLEQGSQQTQGEVLELHLENTLRSEFPLDDIQPIEKGIAGADVLQKVSNRNAANCGSIVWEFKRTKTWSDGWITKLKEDQQKVKADVSILVSDALPKNCDNFVQISGVWITSPACALALAHALRSSLIEIYTAKLSSVGKNEKMEVLYQYLSGPEFRQRMEAIVTSFVEMQKDLQQERRAAEKSFAKREKQIQRVITNTSGMHGDLQGLMGSALQTIPALEAPSSDTEEEIGE